LSLSALQSLTIFVLESVILADIFWIPPTPTLVLPSQQDLVIYDCILCIAAIFSFILCWDAVVHKNVIQTVAFTFINYFLLAYSSLQLSQHVSTWSSAIIDQPALASIPPYLDVLYLKIMVVVVVAFSSLAFTALTWELYREFGWTVFNKLGANLAVRRMFKAHLLLLTLLKLDVFFFVVNTAQMATLGIFASGNAETWIQVAIGVPLSVVTLAVAFYSLKTENKRFMMTFMALLMLALGFTLYQLISVVTTKETVSANAINRLIFFAVVTMLLELATLIQGYRCSRDFGKGLREHMQRYKYTNARRNSMIRPYYGDTTLTQERKDEACVAAEPEEGSVNEDDMATQQGQRWTLE